ncbi:MAG: hypothetical protein M0R76_05790 [Proteobacteria bacterium]|jgi:hypothetical protein|nr:hypothetical protein [Pseudomonadota bacterium]NLN63749.1 hypothetical protein [Myxococcales bacterium]
MSFSSIIRSIRTFFTDPPPVSSLAEVVPGLNVVEGVITVDEPLRSPVRGENCVAYFYESYLVSSGGRSPQPMIHRLRQAEVYGPFTLEMDGGALSVVPRRPGRFTREDHQSLARQYNGANFHGVEKIIAPGAQVRVRGRMRLVNGQPVLKMSLMTVLNKQVAARGVVADRKQRRKRRK